MVNLIEIGVVKSPDRKLADIAKRFADSKTGLQTDRAIRNLTSSRRNRAEFDSADQARWNVYSKLATENMQYLWGMLEAYAEPAPGARPAEDRRLFRRLHG